MANRIEITGQLIGKPEIRVTPAGTQMLKAMVDCGETREPLVLAIVMTGENVRDYAALKPGDRIHATGSLRPVLVRDRGAAGVQVMAAAIRLEDRGNSN